MGRVIALFVALGVVGILMGCGGGSGPGPEPPAAGEVTGRIAGVPNPQAYTITVDGEPVNARADANGHFNIPGLPPGDHTIGCVAPGGYQGGYATVRVRRGQTSDVGDLEPTMGGQIAGIVSEVQQDGSLVPVVNTEVVATSANYGFPDPGEPLPVGRSGAEGDDERTLITAFTDETGSYLMKGVPCGDYDVTVVVAGYDPQVQYVYVSAGLTSAADFMLYRAPEQGVGTVSGTVTGADAGQASPLEGARVTVTVQSPWPVPIPCEVLDSWLSARPGGGGVAPCDPNDPSMPPYIEWDMFTTLTDAQGQYTLNVPIGTQWIECWLDGWEWAGQDVVIEKNQTTTVDFQLTKWVEPPPGTRPGLPD